MFLTFATQHEVLEKLSDSKISFEKILMFPKMIWQ